MLVRLDPPEKVDAVGEDSEELQGERLLVEEEDYRPFGRTFLRENERRNCSR